MTVTPEKLAELRRLLDAAETPWALWDGYGPDGNGDMRVARIGHLSGSGIRADPDSADIYGRREAFELLASAVNALPALLDAAAERDALTVAQPCVMRMGEVYDFAWCETHDRTFALGSSCDHAGLSHVDYLDEDGRRQRGRAVLAEMEMERIAAERDALAAKVERVRALPAKHPAGGWYVTSMRDVLAALDEEPQP